MKKIVISLGVVSILLISFISAYSAKLPDVIEGYFVGVKGQRVELKDLDGKVYSVATDKETRLFIDSRPVFSYKTFKKGMDIYATINKNKVMLLEGYSSQNPGYENPDSIHRVGTITGIDRDILKIKWANGKEVEVSFSKGTIFRKNRKLTKPENIVIGDKVRATFADSQSLLPSIIRIMGDSVKIKGIYSGTLANVDPYEHKITLVNARVYENGSFKKFGNTEDERVISDTDEWENSDIGSGIEIRYSTETPVYLAGTEIPESKLKLYKDKEVYIAARDDFGILTAERMLLQSDRETVYSSKITEINEMASMVELNNKLNLHINAGTIIIDKDRIIDFNNLRSKSDAFIVCDGTNTEKSASLIYVYNRGINVSNISDYQLFQGRLQQITPEEVILKDYFVLNNHAWESFAEEKALYFDDEVKLLNLENPDSKTRYELISAKKFVEDTFSVDEKGGISSVIPRGGGEDKDNSHLLHGRDWYGYFFMQGDRVSGGVVSKSIDSLLRQRAITAEVIEAPTEDANMGWRIKVKNAREYSFLTGEWTPRYNNLTFYMPKALCVKDGEPVKYKVIKPGDKVYFLRDENEIKFIMVY